MADTFQRVRMEPQADGSVYIGVAIEDPSGTPNDQGDKPILTCEWRYCKVAHVHGWGVCDIAGIFGARQKDGQGADVVGTSPKEILVARKAQIAVAQAVPKEVALPKKTDGKGGQIDDKALALP